MMDTLVYSGSYFFRIINSGYYFVNFHIFSHHFLKYFMRFQYFNY
jgi:hypothetical protein